MAAWRSPWPDSSGLPGSGSGGPSANSRGEDLGRAPEPASPAGLVAVRPRGAADGDNGTRRHPRTIQVTNIAPPRDVRRLAREESRAGASGVIRHATAVKRFPSGKIVAGARSTRIQCRARGRINGNCTPARSPPDTRQGTSPGTGQPRPEWRRGTRHGFPWRPLPKSWRSCFHRNIHRAGAS